MGLAEYRVLDGCGSEAIGLIDHIVAVGAGVMRRTILGQGERCAAGVGSTAQIDHGIAALVCVEGTYLSLGRLQTAWRGLRAARSRTIRGNIERCLGSRVDRVTGPKE